MKIREQFSKESNNNLLFAGLLILLLAVIYYSTLLPGVGYNGDTAKFQFVGYVLGTPHTPGYPTYIILNYIFTHLFPWGSIAFKANLLSALFAIFTCLFLYKLLLFLNIKTLVSFVSAITFGLTYTFWSQAVIAEVYSLNALFVSVVLFFFIKWNRSKERKFLFAGCAAYALSFGNHLTMITFLPAIIYWVWVTDRKVLTTARTVIPLALLIVAGALQYSYVFWRTFDPSTRYLEMRTWDSERFIWSVTGGQFKAKIFDFGLIEVLTQRIPMYAKLMLREYNLLIPAGLYGLFKLGDKKLKLFLIVAFLGNLFYAINYDIKDIYIYFIPSYLIFGIFIGYGLSAIRDWKSDSWYPDVLFLCIPLLFFAMNYSAVNQRDNTHDAQQSLATLAQVGDRAVILAPGYKYAEYFWYFRLIEKEDSGSVYIVRDFSPRAIANYLKSERQLHINEIRKDVPFGLPVYCIGSKHRRLLSNYGLRLTKLDLNLYKVTL